MPFKSILSSTTILKKIRSFSLLLSASVLLFSNAVGCGNQNASTSERDNIPASSQATPPKSRRDNIVQDEPRSSSRSSGERDRDDKVSSEREASPQQGEKTTTQTQSKQRKADISRLIKRAKYRNSEVRLNAIKKLGEFNDPSPEMVKAVVGGIADENRTVVEAVFAALQRYGKKASTAVPSLLNALEKEPFPPRLTLIAAIGSIGPEARAALPNLMKIFQRGLTEDKNTIVNNSGWLDEDDYRVAIAEAFGNIGPAASKTFPQLVVWATTDWKYDAISYVTARRLDIVAKIVAAMGVEIEPVLISLLNDKDFKRQSLAAICLAYYGPIAAKAVPKLVAIAQNKDANIGVRYCSVIALGEIGANSKTVIAALQICAGTPRISEDAVSALLKISPGSPALRDAAVLAMGDEDAIYDIESPIRTLAAMGDRAEGAIPSLIKVLSRADNIDIRPVFAALEEIGPASEATGLRIAELLFHKNVDVAVNAAEALRKMGPNAHKSVDALVEALADPRERVRWQSCYALGAIGRKARAAIPELALLLEDKSAAIRASSATAIRKIGVPHADTLGKLEKLIQSENDQDALLSMTEALVSLSNDDAIASSVKVIEARISDEDDFGRASAVLASGAFGRRASALISTLIKLTKAGDKDTQKTSLIALGKLADGSGRIDEVVDVLKRGLESYDSKIRIAAMKGSSWMRRDGGELIPLILTNLARKSRFNKQGIRDERLAAVSALKSIGMAKGATVAGICTFLTAPSIFHEDQAEWEVEKLAFKAGVDALATIAPNDKSAIACLVRCATSVAPRSNLSARLSLKSLNSDMVMDLLLETMRAKYVSNYVHGNTLKAIRKLGPTASKAVLTIIDEVGRPRESWTRRDSTFEDWETAYRAGGEWWGDITRSTLVRLVPISDALSTELISRLSTANRGQALLILQVLDQADAAAKQQPEVIRPLLDSNDWVLRVHAANLIGNETTSAGQLLHKLRALLKDSYPEVQKAAERAVARITK